MRVIIAGSRDCTDRKLLETAIAASQFEITTVISGCARGVDTLGQLWARDHNIPIERFPAQWNIHRKSAGFVRNRIMAENAEALIAVWDGRSPGTRHMISIARALLLEVYVHVY